MKRKILFSTLIIAILIVSTSFCFAKTIEEVLGSVSMTSPDEFAWSVESLLGVIQFICYVIVIAMVIYVGVKYTMAAADERATLKWKMVKLVGGTLLVAMASTVVGWIYEFATA